MSDEIPECAFCQRPAGCVGRYEDPGNPIEFACNECCGHGNEDGRCIPLSDVAEQMNEDAERITKLMIDPERFATTLRELRALRARLAQIELNAEDREALRWLVSWIKINTIPGVTPRLRKAQALSLLDRLTRGEG